MDFLKGSFPLVERCQNTQFLRENADSILTIIEFNTSLQTTGATSHFVANKIYSVLNQCQEKEFAMLLKMRGADKHDIGIVVKNGEYYLIDSDTGLFKFNTLNALRDFMSFLMKHYKYSHLFNRYTLENMPPLESRFPLPKALIKEKPEAVQRSNCTQKTLTFMRDKFYTAYCGAAIIQTAVMDKAKQTRDEIINTYEGAKALGCIIRG
jgi:hypothetical protein